MERLTARSNSNIAAPKELVQNGSAEMCSYLCELYLKRIGRDNRNVCEDCPIQECFEKLAEYEDTGLSPEKVMKLIEDYETLDEECSYALEEIGLWKDEMASDD